MPGPQPPWHPVADGYDVSGRLIQQPVPGNAWTFVQDKTVNMRDEPGAAQAKSAKAMFEERPDVAVERPRTPDFTAEHAERLKADTEVAHDLKEQADSFVEATEPEHEPPKPPGLYAAPTAEAETGTQVGVAEQHYGPDFQPAQVTFGIEAAVAGALAVKNFVEAGRDVYEAVRDRFSPKAEETPTPPQPEPPPSPPPPPPAPPQASPASGGPSTPQGSSPSFGSF